ncbi:MAG: 4-hydroxy-tetrahydrodipicolinate reductase [Flavipsychrobacter sp.]|nr:4-hydroxy-tetrahydrodipicolinate reductase [Flavipsychrobacter sp.]
MNIALIGYGKMGQTIERLAIQRGHSIVLKIMLENKEEMTHENLRKADVAIEFTSPDVALENVLMTLGAGVPIVSGTTGWNDELDKAGKTAIQQGAAFLHTSNFSVGVNIFFEINKVLAELMNEQPNYEVTIEETHHVEKKDAPSGTAITLANQVLANLKRKDHWTSEKESDKNALPVISHRIEVVPGTHHVKYSSPIDDIEIIHTAHNRDGFALGALLAAEYVAGKHGVFTMRDVLGIGR